MTQAVALSEFQITQLSDFLQDENRPERTMGYAELCGFLFGVACSPDKIEESEWLPLVFNTESVEVLNQEPEVGSLIHQLYAELAQQLMDRNVQLPTACLAKAECMDNLQADTPFSQWCAGFMSAHDWLEELWDEYIPEDMAGQFTSLMVVLSFFASEDLAKAYYSELQDNTHTFEDNAAQVLSLHAEAMVEYARIGHTLQQAMEKIKAEKPKPAVSSKIARNEPCPCGSGKKFKKCCGS